MQVSISLKSTILRVNKAHSLALTLDIRRVTIGSTYEETLRTHK